MFTALLDAINANHIPMIFMNGLFTFLALFLIFKKSPDKLIESNEKVNQNKFFYSFDIKDIDWKSLKNDLKTFYEPLGFYNIVIDKESSWMLESDENTQAYIFASLKDNLINLEVYNAPKFELKEQIDTVEKSV
jgi:hypothetical protein